MAINDGQVKECSEKVYCTSVYFAKGSLKFTRQHVMNTIWDKRGVKLKGTMPDMIRYFFILFSGLLNIHTCCGIALGGKLRYRIGRRGHHLVHFGIPQTTLTHSSSISVSSTFNLTLNNSGTPSPDSSVAEGIMSDDGNFSGVTAKIKVNPTQEMGLRVLKLSNSPWSESLSNNIHVFLIIFTFVTIFTSSMLSDTTLFTLCLL